MRWLKKADFILEKVLKTISLMLMGLMVILVFLEVIFRYFLKIPCFWTEELSRLSLVWCVFLASAVAIRHGGHPNIVVLTERFPGVVKQGILVLIYVSIALFGVVLAYYGAKFVYSTRLDHMTSLGYPKNLFYWPAVVGGVLYCIYSVFHIIRLLTGSKSLVKEK